MRDKRVVSSCLSPSWGGGWWFLMSVEVPALRVRLSFSVFAHVSGGDVPRLHNVFLDGPQAGPPRVLGLGSGVLGGFCPGALSRWFSFFPPSVLCSGRVKDNRGCRCVPFFSQEGDLFISCC